MMNVPPVELIAMTCALTGILMLGSSNLRVNLSFYTAQAFLLALVTCLLGLDDTALHLLITGLFFLALKGVLVPAFIQHAINKTAIGRDEGTGVSSPFAMLMALALLGGSYFLSSQLPAGQHNFGWICSTAAISIIFSGLIFMLTRRTAISQIVAFLSIENGIYLFGLTQTKGMPMFVEMGIMLDVCVGVMICGVLALQIKKSFEHIDITLLSELRE